MVRKGRGRCSAPREHRGSCAVRLDDQSPSGSMSDFTRWPLPPPPPPLAATAAIAATPSAIRVVRPASTFSRLMLSMSSKATFCACAVQASVVDLLHFELEGLTHFGDDFHTITRVKRLRQLRALGCHRLRRHTAQHRKARAHDDYHWLSLHVQLRLHSAKDFVLGQPPNPVGIGSDAHLCPRPSRRTVKPLAQKIGRFACHESQKEHDFVFSSYREWRNRARRRV